MDSHLRRTVENVASVSSVGNNLTFVENNMVHTSDNPKLLSDIFGDASPDVP